jgi:hypothetical protein
MSGVKVGAKVEESCARTECERAEEPDEALAT